MAPEIGTEAYKQLVSIDTALDAMKPVVAGQYSAATGAADAEIVLATQSISASNGLLISISEDTLIAFKQATGGATTANDIFKAGTHYLPFTCTHIVHKQSTAAGTITVIGKSTA